MQGGILIAKTLIIIWIISCPQCNKKGTVTSIKKNWKLKDEVGMVGPKNTQTRFVGIITSTIHPYACFSRLSWLRAHT